MSKRKWTKATVIARIQDWHRKGVPVGKIWRHDRVLRAASHWVFGSWCEALVAAGFQPTVQRWSKERVVNELKARFPNGLPREFRRKDHSRLTSAAKRLFGSWHDALVAAGLRQGERKVRRPWTRQRVIEAIQSRHERGLSLSSVWREDKPLHHFAAKTFGTWRLAMEAAGFPLPPTRHWTPEGVIREIQSRHEQGLTLVGIEREDHSLYVASRRLFNGWRNALRAAGIEVKPRRSWTRPSVIDAMLDWQARGLSLSRVWTEDKPLYAAAVSKFGNWEKAMRAAGLQPRPRRKWSKQQIIVELQAWHRQSDRSLGVVYPALTDAAARLFGSVANAMDAAGVGPKRGWWTDRRVVKAIQDRYVRGQPIQIVGFGNKSLAAGARRRFGGWIEAVAAAGLSDKYNKPAPTRTWTREAVVQAILDRRRQGLPLTKISRRDAGLYYAAGRYLGGWRKALAAAGIRPEEAKRTFSKKPNEG